MLIYRKIRTKKGLKKDTKNTQKGYKEDIKKIYYKSWNTQLPVNQSIKNHTLLIFNHQHLLNHESKTKNQLSQQAYKSTP